MKYKFRAWDKKHKEMVLFDSFYELQKWCRTEEELKSFEILGFTGLTDKNGKEIYEGDVVKSDWLDDKQRILNAEVVFSIGRFTCRGLTYDLYKYPELEVIGNKFENPELLEEKK